MALLPSPRRWAIPCLSSLILFAWASRAGLADAETPLDLEWSAPAECPDTAHLRAGVASLLQGSTAEGRVGAVGTVTSREGEWSLDLTITHEGSVAHRTVKAASCPALADAAALILALTIDPVHATLPPPPASGPPAGAPDGASPKVAPSASAPPPLPPPPPSSAPKPVRPPPPRPPPSASTPPRLEVGIKASADADLGSLPGPALGVSGGLALLYGRLRLEAFGAFWPGETATVGIPGLVGSLSATVHLADGGLNGCYVALTTARWELGPCVGLELGALSGSGLGLGSSSPSSTLWSAARGDVRLSFKVARRFALFADLGVAVPFSRSPFDVAGPAGPVQVFEPGAAAGRASLGPEVRF